MARGNRFRGTGSIYKRGNGGSWIISWHDHEGRRFERSTRTTDRATADRMLRKRLSDAALRRDGIIDPELDRFSIEVKKPLRQHVDSYIEHCRRVN
jgi:hypothetical protein